MKGFLNSRWFIAFVVLGWIVPKVAHGQTVITNTRPEVALMASLWEADSVQISPLANAQCPNIAGGMNNTLRFCRIEEGTT
jgi:hypothetical protein